MIPGSYIRDAIGYCDGSPEWWRVWSDLITRSPAHEGLRLRDMDDVWEFERLHGRPFGSTVGAYALYPNQCLLELVQGLDLIQAWQPWTITAAYFQEGTQGPLRRFTYRRLEGLLMPSMTDDCAFWDEDPEADYDVFTNCNGACAAYERSGP